MVLPTEPSATESHGRDRAATIFIKNSLANTVTGVSTACLSLLVPPVLVRTLSASEFAVWALVLQIAGYTALLSLGLQDVVGRYVAFYEERREVQSRDEFVNAAFWVLCAGAVAASSSIFAAGLRLGVLFPQVPAALVPIARDMLWATGITLSIGLPFAVFNGILIGLRRNAVSAAVVGTARFVLAGLLAAVAWLSHALFWLTFCFVAVNAVSYVLLWLSCARVTGVSIKVTLPAWKAFGEIWSYCGTMLVWQAGMFLISGVDVVVVGRVDFPGLAYYSVCLAPITIIAGAMSMLFSPLMQVGAAYAAHGQEAALESLLLRSTRIATVVMLAIAAVLILFGGELLTAWLGPQYARRAAPMLRFIVIGHALRQLAFPYTMLLLATKRQSQLLLSPLAEGATNVLVAIVAGRQFGAVGVASAVMIGSVVGQLMNYFYNLPRTHGRDFDRRGLVVRSVIRPALCFLPLGLLFVAATLQISESQMVAIRSVLLAACFALLWGFAIDREEKRTVLEFLGWRRSGVVI